MLQVDDKQERQAYLLEMLRNKNFGSQVALVKAMQRKGFAVTQPSISRDFAELGISKVRGKYQQLNEQAASGKGELKSLVSKINEAGANLLVVKTQVGAANVIAAKIDELNIKGLVGTVAGDDTIFIASSTKAAQARIKAAVTRL